MSFALAKVKPKASLKVRILRRNPGGGKDILQSTRRILRRIENYGLILSLLSCTAKNKDERAYLQFDNTSLIIPLIILITRVAQLYHLACIIES